MKPLSDGLLLPLLPVRRFEIVVDNEDGPPDEWTATFYPIERDGRSGDALAQGVGTTPAAAIRDGLAEFEADTSEEGGNGA